MSEQSQFTDHIEETRIAIDGALALADLVARHEIVQSQSFHQLVEFLHDAAEAIRRIGDQGDTVRREAALQPLAHGAGRPLGLVTNDGRSCDPRPLRALERS